MIKRLTRFFSLSREERGLFVLTWGVLVAVRMVLKVAPFRHLYRFSGWVSERGRKETALPEDRFDAVVALSVERACTWTPGKTMCLPRALTALIVLGVLGCPARLCIGVSRPGSRDFEAHAWVERHGKVLVGTVAGLDTFPTFPLQEVQRWASQKCGA